MRCTLLHHRPPQLYRWTRLLERNLEHIDTFIAASDFSRRKHREFGFLREMEVLPYFLPDTNTDTIDLTARPHERPYFLYVARLEKIKGAQDLILAFRDYADADLLIAGVGNYRSQLEALSDGNRRVKFLGHLDEQQLRRYYRSAVAVVVPSLCFETFALVLIEAFRESTPVIARRRGPLPELIEQSNGGELFSDPGELLAAMRHLQGNAEYRIRLGRQGHRAYLERWSTSVVMPEFLEIVRQTAERRKREDIVNALRHLADERALNSENRHHA
jgi:glycosyltransferase involved in cell wall biosynthesis